MYLNTKLSDMRKCYYFKKIRFGSTLKNIGDINHDGIDDLAISAVGEQKVYIYHGLKNPTNSITPVQEMGRKY